MSVVADSTKTAEITGKTTPNTKVKIGYGVTLALVCAIAIFFPGTGVAILEFANTVMDTILGSIITGMLSGPGNLKKGLIAGMIVVVGKYLFDSYQLGVIYNGL